MKKLSRFLLLLSAIGTPATPMLAERDSLDEDLKYYADRAAERAEDLKAERERYAAYADKPGDPFAAKYAALTRQIEEAEKSEAKYREFVGIDTGTMAVLKETARLTHDDLVEMNQILMKNWALWVEDAFTGNWTNLVKTGYDTMFRVKVRKAIRENLGVSGTVEPLENYLMDLALGVETKDNAQIAKEWFLKKAGLSASDLKLSPKDLADKVALKQINLDPETIQTLAELSVGNPVSVDWAKARELAMEKLSGPGLDKLKEQYAEQVKKGFQKQMEKELGSMAAATDSLAEQVREGAMKKVTGAIDSVNFATEIAEKIYNWSQADFSTVFEGVKQYRTLLQKATGKPATWDEAFVAWQVRSKFSGAKRVSDDSSTKAVVENTKPIIVSSHVVSSSLDKGRVTMRLETTWRCLGDLEAGRDASLKLTRDDVTLAERIPMDTVKSRKRISFPYTMLNDPSTGEQARGEYEVITVHNYTDKLADFQKEPVALRFWDYEFIWEKINEMGAVERIGQAAFTPKFSVSLVSGNSAQKIALHERELSAEERGLDAARVDASLKAGPVAPIPWEPPANVHSKRFGDSEEIYLRGADGKDVCIGHRRCDKTGKLIFQDISINGRQQGLKLGGENYAWFHDGVQHGPYEKGGEKGYYREGKRHGPWERRVGSDMHLYESGGYVDGALDGEQIRYLDDGATPLSRFTYDHGTLLPPQQYYDKNGDPRDEYCFDGRVEPAEGAQPEEMPFKPSGKGALDGEVKHWRKGQLYETIPFRAGVRHGLHVKGFEPDRREVTYRNGVVDGFVREYKNGLLRTEYEYEKGQKVVQRNYRDVHGESRIESESRYRDDKLHGTSRRYDLASGQVSGETEYVDGVKVWERDVNRITEYKDGVPAVMTEYFKLGGPVRLVKKYNADKTWVETRYYESGREREVAHRGNVPYRGGNLEAAIGSYVEYYEDGAKKTEATYGPEGKLAGVLRHYYPGGVLKTEDDYRDRKHVGISREYFPNGKLKSDVTYSSDGMRNGAQREYFEEGSLKREQFLRDNRLNGKTSVYSAPGVLYEEIQYENGEKNGTYRCYYNDGVLKIEATYLNGKYEGVYKCWYKNGTLKWDFNYKAGRKNGPCIFYNERGGMERKSGIYENDERVGPLT